MTAPLGGATAAGATGLGNSQSSFTGNPGARSGTAKGHVTKAKAQPGGGGAFGGILDLSALGTAMTLLKGSKKQLMPYKKSRNRMETGLKRSDSSSFESPRK